MLSTKLNNKKAKYSKAKKTNTSTIIIKINNPRIIIKIAIVGTGYVGLISEVCFSEIGNTYCC